LFFGHLSLRRNKKQTAVINIRKYKRISEKKKGVILTFRMLVKNFTYFTLHAFPFICKFFYYLLSFVSIISYLLYTQISVFIQWFTTSEDVCWMEHTKRQDKAFFLSRNAFIFPYVYHRGLLFVSS